MRWTSCCKIVYTAQQFDHYMVPFTIAFDVSDTRLHRNSDAMCGHLNRTILFLCVCHRPPRKSRIISMSVKGSRCYDRCFLKYCLYSSEYAASENEGSHDRRQLKETIEETDCSSLGWTFWDMLSSLCILLYVFLLATTSSDSSAGFGRVVCTRRRNLSSPRPPFLSVSLFSTI